MFDQQSAFGIPGAVRTLYSNMSCAIRVTKQLLAVVPLHPQTLQECLHAGHLVLYVEPLSQLYKVLSYDR